MTREEIIKRLGLIPVDQLTKIEVIAIKLAISILKEKPKKLIRRYEIASRTHVDMEQFISVAEILMESDAPNGRTISSVKWWAKAEAKYKVLMADALIAELNKEVNP